MGARCKEDDVADLAKLLADAKAAVQAMTKEERAAMYKRQAEGVVRAEMSWPKPNKRTVNGVVVYDSWEEYCND
jgi:hypothetical protein